jgi:c-di-GMP-binding flagellar brake protein YcgR
MVDSLDNIDRRRTERFPAHLCLTLQPVNAERRVVGDSFEAVSFDISQGGLGCVSDKPLLADLAIVRILSATSDQEMTVLAQRIRCQRKGPMFEMSLQFVEKMKVG